mmetsp:Transcript_35972/g.36205  ORF Transcript_35972/g.36205 Transcript_35972/m.36205 type:complete len:85 (-) Transcript_35972:149-403(-)
MPVGNVTESLVGSNGDLVRICVTICTGTFEGCSIESTKGIFVGFGIGGLVGTFVGYAVGNFVDLFTESNNSLTVGALVMNLVGF